MFNDTFYPTPRHIAAEMFSPIAYLHRKRFLDPEGGKGDLCDYVRKEGCQEIATIEIQPELQAILRDKGYRVLGSDFLTWKQDEMFDLIAMNPPFSHDAEHFVKAWELIRKWGGELVCILNASTLRNRRTQWELLAGDIVDKHSFVEPKSIKNGFRGAERSTDVEIVIVWVKYDVKANDFRMDNPDLDPEIEKVDFDDNALAPADYISALVARYDAARELYLKEFELRTKRGFYIEGIKGIDRSDERAKELMELKKAFWNYIFNRTKIGEKTTSGFQDRFQRFTAERSNIAFTYENIMELLDMFQQSKGEILEECVLDVFDAATKYHKDNIIHIEGWKTNKAWKIAPRIIIPYALSFDPRFGHWNFKYENRDFYHDLDIVLSWLSGVKVEGIARLEYALEHLEEILNGHRRRFISGNSEIPDIETQMGTDLNWQRKFETTFFTFRIYKKGTIHLDFKDLDLLAKLNITAARGKKWLGPGDN